MINTSIYDKQSSESVSEYKRRIYNSKYSDGLTWDEVAYILNTNLVCDYSKDKYRKECYRYSNSDNDSYELQELNDEIIENISTLRKEKYKLQDERTQINAGLRAMAREDTLKEIALEVASNFNTNKLLSIPTKIERDTSEKVGTLIISDWHFGLEVNTYYNQYNPDIAISRINRLYNKVLQKVKEHNIKELNVINLGDLISGNIHLPLRISSRVDVVSQTIQVGEILAEFLSDLSKYVIINYGSVTDNHSRIDPNKKESIQLETFARFIDWHLFTRLNDNPNFNPIVNKLGDDICTFKVFDYDVIAVHGDLDKSKSILSKLTTYSQEHYDMILSAHMHHFSADEANNTELYCNGALIGQDDYSAKLRCNSDPSQLFIISTKDNITEIIYKIKLK